MVSVMEIIQESRAYCRSERPMERLFRGDGMGPCFRTMLQW
jgi:hypothetical protein